MKIKHFPITNTEKVCEYYSKKDGVPIKYVCTTDFHMSDIPLDIFYRSTPHPEFGNRYFGIRLSDDKNYYISNVDNVENLTFGLVEDDNGDLQYSQYHHNYKSFDNGNMIDGGREYVRYSGKIYIHTIKDGEMIYESPV
jgi:hypothetical protein